MDTYFFENPAKAIIKFVFIFITYLGSIVMKEFSISIVLPTIAIYFISNSFDYFDIAFYRADKVRRLRNAALVIFFLMLIIAVGAFCVITATNNKIVQFVKSNYCIWYLICSVIWIIPLVDGFRGQFDKIRKSSDRISDYMTSDKAYQVMRQAVESSSKNLN